MTGDPMDKGEGERLERGRRRRFWGLVGFFLAIGMVLGFVFGFTSAHRDESLAETAWGLPDGVLIALLAGAILAFSYGCWTFLKAIDEVELTDNLWASTASYYAYCVLFPSWWVLGQAGITAPPRHWVIFFAALAAGGAVYLYRKWRAR